MYFGQIKCEGWFSWFLFGLNRNFPAQQLTWGSYLTPKSKFCAAMKAFHTSLLLKGAISATPNWFWGRNFNLIKIKLLEISTKKYLRKSPRGIFFRLADCRMVCEMRKQYGLDRTRITSLLMEDKMEAGAFGWARNYGWDDLLRHTQHTLTGQYICLRGF